MSGSVTKRVYYECGICGHVHPWNWNGDCREDANRFSLNDLDDRFSEDGYELRSMEDRTAADESAGTWKLT